MRKFLALALAVAMVFSLASVSFAATTQEAEVELVGPYRYDADYNKMIYPTTPDDSLRYGSGVYYLIKIDEDNDDGGAAGFEPTGRYKQVEKLKVKAEFEAGKDLVESISIVKKYVDKDNCGPTSHIVTNGITTSGFYYFVEFKIAKKETTAESDIVAKLEFNRKADSDEGFGKIKDEKEEAEFTVFYKNTWINKNTVGSLVDGDKVNIEWDTDYAFKFDTDEEVELSFGHANDGDNEGTFTVDVSGQGKVYLRYNTKPNEAIAAANPGVKMNFVNFNNCKFNRVGEFVYEMDDMVAAYKVVGDQLVEIKGLEISNDEATFYTRLLGSYVFADAELVNPVVEAPAAEAPAAEVTNPTTGGPIA